MVSPVRIGVPLLTKVLQSTRKTRAPDLSPEPAASTWRGFRALKQVIGGSRRYPRRASSNASTAFSCMSGSR